MTNNNKLKFYFLLFFSLLFFISILISFLLNINLSNIFGPFISNEELLEFNINAKNGGAVSDLTSHWRYINLLKKDLSNLISSQLGPYICKIN